MNFLVSNLWSSSKNNAHQTVPSTRTQSFAFIAVRAVHRFFVRGVSKQNFLNFEKSFLIFFCSNLSEFNFQILSAYILDDFLFVSHFQNYHYYATKVETKTSYNITWGFKLLNPTLRAALVIVL